MARIGPLPGRLAMMNRRGQKIVAHNSCFINDCEKDRRFMDMPVSAKIKSLAAAALLLPLMTGCETIMPVNSRLEQDVLEIKTKLNESLDRQATTERSLSSLINSLSENLDKTSNM